MAFDGQAVLAAWDTLALMPVAVVTGFVTSAFGVGGGVLLLAAMTLVLPVAAAVPLHGVVQLGANAGRTLMLARRARPGLVLAFAAGGVAGAAAGGAVFVRLPESVLELVLGAFVIASCWLPLPGWPTRGGRSAAAAGAGALTTLATVFVGATGPVVAACLRPLGLDRHAHVATFSACMTVQHGLKLAVFGAAGFAYGRWIPWLAGMLACVLLGTWLGRRMLDRLPERRFRRILVVILTLLGARLLVAGTIGTTTLVTG